MKYVFLTTLVLCACVQQEDFAELVIVAVGPEVSEALARQRTALVSDINY